MGVKHPNGIFYRLQFVESEVRPSYFINGDGPRAGLLREDMGGTILRPIEKSPIGEPQGGMG